jgi:hypothetical protein
MIQEGYKELGKHVRIKLKKTLEMIKTSKFANAQNLDK